MTQSYTLGRNGKLYVGETLPMAATIEAYTTALTAAVGASGIISNARDVNVNLSKESLDATTRENDGWSQTAPGLKDGTIEFDMLWKPTDPNFSLLRDAWLNDTEVFAAALDGAYDTVGSQGPAGAFVCTGFKRAEPVRDLMVASVTLKPSSLTGWYEKSA